MSKVAVVYWSGTGNTEAMAFAVAEGAKEKGADAVMLTASEFSANQVGSYDAIAFGCPSMGTEELEDSEFLPMFEAVKDGLADKKVALFGSYGWGEGQWMEDWAAAVQKDGAVLVDRPVISCEEPGEEERIECETLGATLALA